MVVDDIGVGIEVHGLRRMMGGAKGGVDEQKADRRDR